MLSQTRQPIALISDHADPAAAIGAEEAGGQNVYVRQVGETLAALGWQVDMFTRKTQANQPNIVEHSPFCRTIRLKAGPEQFVPRDRLFQYMPEFIESFKTWQSQQSITYPLIHTNYWLSAWVGLTLKQHNSAQLIVHTYHSLGAIKYQSTPTRPAIANLRLAVEQKILEQANCVIATSPQELQSLRQWVSPHGQIQIIPCGTDTNNFHLMSKSEVRTQLRLHPEEKIVLYVGRFDPRKGIETLVRSCVQLKAIHGSKLKLVIVGGSSHGRIDGEERTRIESIVQELGLGTQTLFVGQVSHDKLPLYYCAADVCVIPSHYEPFGLVAIEAMACGTPVVASDVGGLKFTILPEETGLLVPPQDAQAFAVAIQRILGDESWTLKLRKQGPANINQRFSWRSVGIELSDLYRRILAQSLMHESLMPESLIHQSRHRSPLLNPRETPTAPKVTLVKQGASLPKALTKAL
jgi:glycosyltransferase involved in cell wall biosynthesis